MELAKIKACICEGAAEAAIIDVLLDNDLFDAAVWNPIYVFHHANKIEPVRDVRDGHIFVIGKFDV